MKLEGFTLVAQLGSAALKHNGGIRGARVSPDGKRIYSIGDGTDVHVWDATTGERQFDLRGTDRGLYALAVSPDGRRVFVGGHQAQLFELPSKKHTTLPVKKPLVVAAAFAPDNSILYGDDRFARRFDARGNEVLPALKGHASRIDAIAVSRDGRRVLTCGGDGKIKLHALDRLEPEVVATWEGHARSCGFSPDGTLVWTVGWSHAVVRGTTTGKAMFNGTLQGITRGAMTVDGSRIAIATNEAVHVFALPGGKPAGKIAFPGVDMVEFTPDGTRLVVANDGRGLGEGCGITVFDVATETRVLPADTGHTGAVEALAIARDMPHALFSLGADGMLALWDLETRTALERVGNIAGQGRAIASTNDGGTVVTASDHGELHAWQVARTEGVRFDVQGSGGVAVAISPDERYVAYAPYLPGHVHVFELKSRAHVATLDVHRAHLRDVTWLTSDLVASSAADETIAASRVPSGERVWTAKCSGFVEAICLVGDVVVAGTTYGQLAIFDAATGAPRGELRASGREVQRTRAVDAGHVAVVRRADDYDSSVVELWSIATRAVVATADLSDLGDQARSLAAAPDGRRIYVGTNASRVLVFERSSH